MGWFGFGRKSSTEITSIKILVSEGESALLASRLEEAVTKLTTAITAAQALRARGDDLQRSALTSISVAHIRRGELDLAETALDRAIDIIVTRGWRNSARHALALNNVATLRWHQNQRAEALRVLEHAYGAIADRARTDTDHSTIATLLGNLIGLHVESKNLAEARQWFAIATDHCRSRGGALKIARAQLIARRFAIWRLAGGPAAELVDFRRDVDEFRQIAGDRHPSCGNVIGILGMVLLLVRQLDEAESHFRAAIELAQSAGNDRTIEPAVLLNNLGAVFREQGRLAEAESTLREALASLERKFGPSHFHPANAMKNLGQTLQRAGRSDEAADLYREALNRLAAAPPSPEVSEKAVEIQNLLGSA